MQVFVRDNNIDQALKALKRKMQREGTFREMKLRRFYEKPSEKATRQKAESERRRPRDDGSSTTRRSKQTAASHARGGVRNMC